MALIYSFAQDTGLDITDAYMKITDLSVFKDEESGKFYMTYGVETHASEKARADKKRRLESTRYQTEYDPTVEVYAQAYTHLKTICVGAKDV